MAIRFAGFGATHSHKKATEYIILTSLKLLAHFLSYHLDTASLVCPRLHPVCVGDKLAAICLELNRNSDCKATQMICPTSMASAMNANQAP